MRFYFVGFLALMLPIVAMANNNAVSCAAFCIHELTVGTKSENDKDSKPSKVYKFLSFDGPTYGKALKALYDSCDKLNGKLTLEDSAAEESPIVVNMKSACRDNPK